MKNHLHLTTAQLDEAFFKIARGELSSTRAVLAIRQVIHANNQSGEYIYDVLCNAIWIILTNRHTASEQKHMEWAYVFQQAAGLVAPTHRDPAEKIRALSDIILAAPSGTYEENNKYLLLCMGARTLLTKNIGAGVAKAC